MRLKPSLATSLDSLLEQQETGNWSIQKLVHKSPAFITPPEFTVFSGESKQKRASWSSTSEEVKPMILLFFETAMVVLEPEPEPSTTAIRLKFLTQSPISLSHTVRTLKSQFSLLLFFLIKKFNFLVLFVGLLYLCS